ncbi:two-component response regulator [Gracilibacillus boraciitolerans JCM 21714]|uniref:Two-component response regulator n=1 Tax=Gracilibacillus boraciitolerans JCM 21714 TaxID=1298598 RepID=W4VJB2_9BACI|nr:response regulator [Gracilibacillus boraciitolerans]GAE93246.1 two-component response regulator [Gracilibacillus boraciitolerans JCM 21714]
MLKAVIFDDAPPIVIKGLQEMIDWSKYNIIIVGSATDGNTAMKVVNDLQPDIILTDIRKPGLDGLQLIEFVVDIFPEITCVVFSGFKEYDYVKKALKLGVVDYLEKPITIEKIEELIPQILAKIEEQKQYNSLKSQSKLSYKEQLERAAMELLFKGYNAEQKWKNIIDQLSEFEVQSVTVLTSSERLNWKEGTPSTYSVIELHLEDQFIYVFYKFSVITSYDRILEDDVDSLEAIVGVGTTMEKKEGTLKSYNDSLKALRYGQYVAEPGFHSYDELKRSYIFQKIM